MTLDDHDVKIDEQVNKFLDLNHNLTFFLVTGAVGTLGFTLAFANEHSSAALSSFWLLFILGVAGVAGLCSAWAGLHALKLDQQSFQLHLKYRYQRKSLTDLTKQQQEAWDRLSSRASTARRYAFNLLVATVATQAIFLFALLSVGKDLPMHHYGEDSTSVSVAGDEYVFEFTNKVSKAKITMNVPAVGALEDPTKRLDPNGARDVANEIAHLLRRVLG
jgi:hypothetical protein